MAVSYDNLWKLLIDRKINKTDLRDIVGISNGTLAKLSKNEYVALSVLERICLALGCNIQDIIEFIPSQKESD